LTPAQRNYIAHYIDTLLRGLEEDMEPGTERELVIDMDAVADRGADQPRPAFYYAEEAQQTRYTCAQCGDFNDIRGRYGYCASCGWRNNVSSMRTALEVLRARHVNQITPEDVVRSAVSEFDACCRDMAVQLRKRIPMKPARRAELERLVFHDPESPTIATMKSMLDVDLLRGVGDELPFIKMMMHRRHVFEHNAGVADERYVRLSGDADAREGILIRETQANAHRLINGLTRMAGNLDADFHEIFPPTEWPVNHHRERQERRQQRMPRN
jgi:hypothetical protein